MRADLLRWAILGLTVLLLGAIQYGAFKSFIAQKDESSLVAAYDINLKAIGKIWEKKVKYPTPEALVGPIRKIFDPRVEEAPVETGPEGPEEESPEAPEVRLPFDVLAVLFPMEGKGIPLLLVAFGKEREYFARGEEMPDGTIFQEVQRVGEREYKIDFRDEEKQQTKSLNFKVEEE